MSRKMMALAALIALGTARAAGPLTVAVDLRDDSRIVGTLDVESIPCHLLFADVEVGLADILRIERTAPEEWRITLRNGDTLVAHILLPKLRMATLLGPVEIPLEKAVRMRVTSGALAHGLVAHWTFDDGKSADEIQGVEAKPNPGLAFRKGLIGEAARIESTETRLHVQDRRVSMAGWREATVAAWIFLEDYSTYGNVVTRTDGNGCQLTIGGNYGYWVAGAFSVALEQGAHAKVSPRTFALRVDPYPAKGRWYHLAGTYDGRRIRYYVDGKLDGEAEVETPGLAIRDDPEATTVLGGSASRPTWRDTHYVGLLDEVKIWDRALTSGEVEALVAEGREGLAKD